MATTDLERRVDSLIFQVDKSMRYHHRFRGFYDTANRIFMFAIIAAGGGAVLHKAGDAPEIGGAIAALIAALNLVWVPSHKARDHHLLHGRFSDLMVRMRTDQRTEENYVLWDAERHRIEKDEPPIFHALEADCDNQVRHAWGRDERMVKIVWWKHWTMYLLRHSKTRFEDASVST